MFARCWMMGLHRDDAVHGFSFSSLYINNIRTSLYNIVSMVCAHIVSMTIIIMWYSIRWSIHVSCLCSGWIADWSHYHNYIMFRTSPLPGGYTLYCVHCVTLHPRHQGCTYVRGATAPRAPLSSRKKDSLQEVKNDRFDPLNTGTQDSSWFLVLPKTPPIQWVGVWDRGRSGSDRERCVWLRRSEFGHLIHQVVNGGFIYYLLPRPTYGPGIYIIHDYSWAVGRPSHRVEYAWICMIE